MPSLVSCFSVMTYWLSAVWIFIRNVWSYQTNERSGIGALGWHVLLRAGSDAECHLGPADTRAASAEGRNCCLQLVLCLRWPGAPNYAHMEFPGERGFPWYFFIEMCCFLLPFLTGIFSYMVEEKGFFFFLLIQGSYWIRTSSSLKRKHLTCKVNHPAQRHLAHMCTWWVSVEQAVLAVCSLAYRTPCCPR